MGQTKLSPNWHQLQQNFSNYKDCLLYVGGLNTRPTNSRWPTNTRK